MGNMPEHLIVKVCRKHGITFEMFAESVRKRNGRKKKVSTGYISQIIRGERHPSRKFAIDISATYTEIPLEYLFRFPNVEEPRDFRPLRKRFSRTGDRTEYRQISAAGR